MSHISSKQIDIFYVLRECFFRAVDQEKSSPKGENGEHLRAAKGVIENIVLQADGYLDPEADNFGTALDVVYNVLCQCVEYLEDAGFSDIPKLEKRASLVRDSYKPI